MDFDISNNFSEQDESSIDTIEISTTDDTLDINSNIIEEDIAEDSNNDFTSIINEEDIFDGRYALCLRGGFGTIQVRVYGCEGKSRHAR